MDHSEAIEILSNYRFNGDAAIVARIGEALGLAIAALALVEKPAKADAERINPDALECESCRAINTIDRATCIKCGARTLRPFIKTEFVGIGLTVMRGGEHIARARSANMARRISNALNSVAVNRRGR